MVTSKSCSRNCNSGLKVTVSEAARVSDADALRLGDAFFCDCALGQSQRKLYQRRVASWTSFERETASLNAARALACKEGALDGGVPEKFKGLTLKSLVAAARVGGQIDPGKTKAIAAARELQETNEVTGANGIKKRSILFWGPDSGIAKTGCLTPVFEHWQNRGVDCLFISFPDLVEQVRAGFKDEKWFERLERARTVPVLFLDDLGYPDRDASDYVREVAMSIIRHRHGENLPTLMTSNLTLDDLSDQLGQTLYRRVAEMAAVIQMGGKVLSVLG